MEIAVIGWVPLTALDETAKAAPAGTAGRLTTASVNGGGFGQRKKYVFAAAYQLDTKEARIRPPHVRFRFVMQSEDGQRKAKTVWCYLPGVDRHALLPARNLKTGRVSNDWSIQGWKILCWRADLVQDDQVLDSKMSTTLARTKALGLPDDWHEREAGAL
jgi:hypothetical protein